jgi:hypothetical protein
MVQDHDDYADEKIKLSQNNFIELNNELGIIKYFADVKVYYIISL